MLEDLKHDYEERMYSDLFGPRFLDGWVSRVSANAAAKDGTGA